MFRILIRLRPIKMKLKISMCNSTYTRRIRRCNRRKHNMRPGDTGDPSVILLIRALAGVMKICEVVSRIVEKSAQIILHTDVNKYYERYKRCRE